MAPSFLAPPLEVVWQAPLYYNHYLTQRPWFVRAIGIMRAAYMLGLLSPAWCGFCRGGSVLSEKGGVVVTRMRKTWGAFLEVYIRSRQYFLDQWCPNARYGRQFVAHLPNHKSGRFTSEWSKNPSSTCFCSQCSCVATILGFTAICLKVSGLVGLLVR